MSSDLTAGGESTPKQWLTFVLKNETYAVDVLHVKEVVRCPELSLIPGAPDHVLGIINLRGEVFTVNDLRVLLGLPSIEMTDRTRVMLLELDGHVQGLVVDEVSEIIDVNPSNIIPTTTSEARYVTATYRKNDKLYILMSIEALLDTGDDDIDW